MFSQSVLSQQVSNFLWGTADLSKWKHFPSPRTVVVRRPLFASLSLPLHWQCWCATLLVWYCSHPQRTSGDRKSCVCARGCVCESECGAYAHLGCFSHWFAAPTTFACISHGSRSSPLHFSTALILQIGLKLRKSRTPICSKILQIFMWEMEPQPMITRCNRFWLIGNKSIDA